MRKSTGWMIILVSGILFSCQKEVDYANGSGTGTGTGSGGLLTKLVSKSGGDSSTILFGYNSSKKLIKLDITSASGGNTTQISQRAERNAQGIIQRIILKADAYQQAGIDSVITVVNYTGGKYTSKVSSFDFIFVVLKDSVALTYDAGGKVTTEKSFADNGAGSYDEYQKVEYTYSGSNIATIKHYTYDPFASTYDLVETFSYDQYDTKVSPTFFGAEAFVFGSPFFFSSNNPLKSSITATGAPAQTYTTVYTYNSANKPLTAVSTIQPGNSTSTGTYYYQ